MDNDSACSYTCAGWSKPNHVSQEYCGNNLRNSVYIIVKKNLMTDDASILSSHRSDHLISSNNEYIAKMQTNGAFKVYVNYYTKCKFCFTF